ncbi:hypothetical protein BDV95DRAFT_604797 [Massariosphaeria phaeospora]|uniref:ABC-type Fe3+ transport system n=1 Tax=Massariosphaeria phaeospora TaxID=100035 RepID=A0A7C8MCA7_9PLEO|nr:hypothetical protein BDV95DRAFT_604797 [Massariosphaeria phaeospora]
MRSSIIISFCFANPFLTLAYDTPFAFKARPTIENRTIDDIYQAALAEGGVVTAWHGGDEKNQQDALKKAFEERFPGMTLNITVDVSKYHNGLIDEQLANGNLYVDSAILQTLHDYPRWKEAGALLHYAPLDFDKIHTSFRDIHAAYYGVNIFGWNIDFADFLDPNLRDRIVLTYPNDDDAVLYTFDLIMQQLGAGWFDDLLLQNPRWVRGSATPTSLIDQANNKGAAIFKDAPHPESTKLLHNFLISKEYLETTPRWTVRTDAPAHFPKIFDELYTNVNVFADWMADRERVERLRFWFEKQIGTPQGLSPLEDDL